MVYTGISKTVCLLLAVVSLVHSRSCVTDDDCVYGGVCDPVVNRCACKFACNRFASSKLVCAEKRAPQTQCIALTTACELQQNIALTPFNHTLFRQTLSCKKMVSESYEEFCKDQSYCSGNGICLKRVGLQQQYCRCVSNFSGNRCETKSPVLMSVIKNFDPSVLTEGNTFDMTTIVEPDQKGISSAPIIATVIASTTATTLLVFLIYKRSPRPSTGAPKTQEIEPKRGVTTVIPSMSAPDQNLSSNPEPAEKETV